MQQVNTWTPSNFNSFPSTKSINIGNNLESMPSKQSIFGIDDAIVGGIIAAVGAIASAGIANGASKRRQRESQKWQEEMTDKQNEYNSPKAQMARLQEAGVNPVSEGGISNVASQMVANPGKADTKAIDFSSALQSVVGLKQAQVQDKLANSQVELNQAQARNIDSKLNVEIEAIKSTIKKNDADIQNANNIYKLNSAQFEFQKEIEKAKLDIDQKNALATRQNLESMTNAINKKLDGELLILDAQEGEITAHTESLKFQTQQQKEMWEVASKFYAQLKEKEANSGGLFNTGLTLADIFESDSDLHNYIQSHSSKDSMLRTINPMQNAYEVLKQILGWIFTRKDLHNAPSSAFE